MYERFHHLKPPRFDGVIDPAQAKDWIKRLQHIFHYMRLTKAERVAYAVNQLDKWVMCWWEVMIQTEDVETMTSARFTQVFREKYLNEARFAAKVREFMDLKHVNMTTVEYAAKFKELSQYAPKMIASNDARKMKFMHGLRLEVAKQVDSGEIGRRSYADAVQRAVRIFGWDATGEKVTTTNTEGLGDYFGNPNQGYKPRFFLRT